MIVSNYHERKVILKLQWDFKITMVSKQRRTTLNFIMTTTVAAMCVCVCLYECWFMCSCLPTWLFLSLSTIYHYSVIYDDAVMLIRRAHQLPAAYGPAGFGLLASGFWLEAEASGFTQLL